MRFLGRLSVCMFIIWCGSANAADPYPGWYAGILLGAGYTPRIGIDFNVPNACSTTGGCTSTSGTVRYGGAGIIGGQIGYRYDHYRVEAEPVFLYAPFNKISVGPYTYTSKKTSTTFPLQRFDGYTSVGALMFNGYFDFFTSGRDCNFAPYLGLGIGGGRAASSLKMYCNTSLISCSKFSEKTNTAAAQGIVGFSYFMDSYTWITVDYRYFATPILTTGHFNSRAQIQTINFTISGLFKC